MTKATKKRRILLADDHELVRRGIRGLLRVRRDWKLVGEEANGRGAVVPTKNSAHIEIVAFTESRPVAFPGHADSTLLSARLFPSPRCSACGDSCSSASAPGPATFESWS
jgi:hypothetical protein